jgi:predicted RNA binding protein YcfA (HicA-like mRNA interferase family)
VKSVSGKEFAKVLIQHGWQLRRINGSHHIFTKTGNTARLSVPVHASEPLKIGLLRHLMKLAGIDTI